MVACTCAECGQLLASGDNSFGQLGCGQHVARLEAFAPVLLSVKQQYSSDVQATGTAAGIAMARATAGATAGAGAVTRATADRRWLLGI